MFDRRGILVIEKKDGMVDDEVMMSGLEAGAEDVIVEEDHYEIITAVEDFTSVRDTLATEGFVFTMAELQYLPQTMTKLTSEDDIKNMQKLIDLMEDHDDVQNIYHNWEE